MIGAIARLGVAGLLALAAPGAAQQRNDVVGVSEDDAAMNAAIQFAQARLPGFLAHLAKPEAGETEFVVKYNLIGREPAEFIFAGDLHVQGAKLSGKLVNKPLAKGFSEGQVVAIPLNMIIDWGYRKNGVMQGHYTTRVLFRELDEATVSGLKADWGWQKSMPD